MRGPACCPRTCVLATLLICGGPEGSRGHRRGWGLLIKRSIYSKGLAVMSVRKYAQARLLL